MRAKGLHVCEDPDPETGGARIHPLGKGALREVLSRGARWMKPRKTKGGLVTEPADVPDDVVDALRERGVWRNVPALTGIVEAPTLTQPVRWLMPGIARRFGQVKAGRRGTGGGQFKEAQRKSWVEQAPKGGINLRSDQGVARVLHKPDPNPIPAHGELS